MLEETLILRGVEDRPVKLYLERKESKTFLFDLCINTTAARASGCRKAYLLKEKSCSFLFDWMGQKTRMDSINAVVGTKTTEEYSAVAVSDRRSFSERYNFSHKDVCLPPKPVQFILVFPYMYWLQASTTA